MGVFDPVHLILIVSFILLQVAFQMKSRRKMLSFKFSSDILTTTYYALIGGFAGSAGAAIAVVGGFVQLVTPDTKLKQTLPLRIGIAVLLSVVGSFVLARDAADYLPFLAVVASRFIELSHSTFFMRLGFLATALFWVVYNYANSFDVALWLAILTMIFIFVGFVRHETRLFR